jgi:hypothetical protein
MSECYKCKSKLASNYFTVGSFHIWLCGDCCDKADQLCVEVFIKFLDRLDKSNPAPLVADLRNVYGSPNFKGESK